MPMSFDVRLPRDQEPVFPAACVACGAPDPADLFVVRQRRFTLFSLLAPILFWLPANFEARAPACVECRHDMKRFARWRGWLLIILATAAVMAVFQYGSDYFPENKTARRLTMIGIVIVLIAPYIIYMLMRPPAFDITVWKTSVDYEFRDEAYAAAFAERNDATYE